MLARILKCTNENPYVQHYVCQSNGKPRVTIYSPSELVKPRLIGSWAAVADPRCHLPQWCVEYPCARSFSASVVISNGREPTGLHTFMVFSELTCMGSRPVIRDVLVGPHTAAV